MTWLPDCLEPRKRILVLSWFDRCVRGTLYNRRHFLWIFVILLVVCVAIQTFVTRNEKLTGLPDLRFTASKESLSPSLQYLWEDLGSESSEVVKSDVDSQQTKRIADLQDEVYGEPSDKVDEANTGSQTEGGKVSPGTPPQTKQIDHTEAACQPKSHIVFLKTHKTASSTILNILYRYGESRNLTFALPVNKQSQLFYPYSFASHYVEGVKSRAVKEYDIICNHMRFNKAEVAKVMPEDSFYFSVLRHPVSMMESIFIYYKSIAAFHKFHSLDEFLDDSFKNYNLSLPNINYAHNLLAFDFGVKNNVADNAENLEERVSEAIASIEKDFHLILLTEFFDESMILLKHALCWSLEDVASFRLNSRSEGARSTLSPSTAEKIKRWNVLDWRIYLHCNATFWHKVDTLVGREQMQREVSQLRELQAKLAKTCLKDAGSVEPSKIKDANLKPFQSGAAVILGYNLNTDLDEQTKTKCHRLITPELQYTERLYSQQFPEKYKRIVEEHRKRHNIVKRKVSNIKNRNIARKSKMP